MIRPLEDKIVLEIVKEAEKKTEFGLIIAGAAEEKPSEGIVVAKGPGARFADGSIMEIDLKVGDKVMFSKYQGNEITHKGKDYLLIAYRDIFAVLEDD